MNGWNDGPMPAGTYNWGGVVLKGDKPSAGFYFADFCGDHVILCPDGKRVEAADIALYCNCLELPQGVKSRAGA